MRRGHGEGQGKLGHDEFPKVECHPHSFEVIERTEGYKEFRCTPVSWSYPSDSALRSTAAEFYSQRMGVDKHGWSETSEFWSGSDAALKFRELSRNDLAMRELVALSSRRSIGLNAPKNWISMNKMKPFSSAWEEEASDVHFSQVDLDDEEQASIWSHYGMDESSAEPVIFGYGMRKSRRPDLGRSGETWCGGIGTWYPWLTLRDWERWPRRQDVQASAVSAESGHLLLFISHRWESLDHPDPDNVQLLCLNVGLLLSLAAALLQETSGENGEKTQSGLPDLIAEFLRSRYKSTELDPLRTWASSIKALAEQEHDESSFYGKSIRVEGEELKGPLDEIRSRFLIWYDYSSMYQVPRTDAEEAEFRAEIQTLNEIQAQAGTVVIAGDTQYLSRAWCFLELCGGMRHRIAELTPSWGSRVGIGDSVTKWASRSDQLIAALNSHGLGSIEGTHLEATNTEDLEVIAGLLAKLPITAMIETDDSDLIGGSLPMPYRSGEWILSTRSGPLEPSHECSLTPVNDFGYIPESLQDEADDLSASDRLAEPVGIWVYTTNRALTLAWTKRVPQIWAFIRSELATAYGQSDIYAALRFEASPDIACIWADSRSLSDDGAGFTRVIPSSVDMLVIVTQADLPDLCRIYDQVVKNHVACGGVVIVYSPETGRTLIYEPTSDETDGREMNVLAVPRIRRSDAQPRRMFVPQELLPKDIEVLPALRLDPADGTIGNGELHEFDKQASEMVATGKTISAEWFLEHSMSRARIEGLSRSIAATWDEWFSPLVHQGRWIMGLSPAQMQIIEALLREAYSHWDNPFKRRRFIKAMVEEHEGYLLPPNIIRQASEFAEYARQAEESESR